MDDRISTRDRLTSVEKKCTPYKFKDGVKVELKRKLGLPSAVAFNVGIIIGSGIFISPKGVLYNTGSVGMCLVVWALCGLLCMMGALSFAELGTLIPYSGGEFTYIMAGFGPMHRFWGPFPGFIKSFLLELVVKPTSHCVLALTCAKYTLAPFIKDNCDAHPPVAVKLFAASLMWFVSAINCFSVTFATRLQVAFLFSKMAAVCVILIGGIVRICQGHTSNFNKPFEGSVVDFAQITLAFYSGFWAYDGWASINEVTEEIIKPNRNLPLCIVISIPLVIVCYLSVNVSYFTVMSPDQLLASPAVAVTWGSVVLKQASFLIPAFVAISSLGTLNGSVFAGARASYATSREGHTPMLLSMVHVGRCTPTPGIILTTITASAWLIPSGIDELISACGFTSWMSIAACMVSLFVMRSTRKNQRRVYKVPVVFPAIVLLASLYLVITPLVLRPRLEFVLPLALAGLGFILYTVFVYNKCRIPGYRNLTRAIQIFLDVAAPSQTLEYTSLKESKKQHS